MPLTGSLSLCNHVCIDAVPVPGASETCQNQQLPQKTNLVISRSQNLCYLYRTQLNLHADPRVQLLKVFKNSIGNCRIPHPVRACSERKGFKTCNLFHIFGRFCFCLFVFFGGSDFFCCCFVFKLPFHFEHHSILQKYLSYGTKENSFSFKRKQSTPPYSSWLWLQDTLQSCLPNYSLASYQTPFPSICTGSFSLFNL